MRSGRDPSSRGDVMRGRGRLRSRFGTFGYRGCLAAAIGCMLILAFPVRAKADTIISMFFDVLEQIVSHFNNNNQSDDKGDGVIVQSQTTPGAQSNTGASQDFTAKGAVVTAPTQNI